MSQTGQNETGAATLWCRYQQYLCQVPSIGMSLDISRMSFGDDLFGQLAEPMAGALSAMAELEGGAKANRDEDRMVGHYWLRAPGMAPDDAIRSGIEDAVAAVKQLADDVETAVIKPERGEGFYVVLVIGIGGSALGPRLIADALGTADDPVLMRFLDNTDPDGVDRLLAELDDALEQTLTIVVSKSGGTKETRNGMLEVAAAYERRGLSFARHAVAITCEGSQLDQQATSQRWLKVLPLWNWVGGRMSATSPVGLLPAALMGVDVDAMLEGARLCDEATRATDVMKNPAALLAMAWRDAVTNRTRRNMVIIPYRDRLALLGRYLQQLVMESLGKARDRDGRKVHEGLTVYGNKGSTDQHAYIQQLREGTNDFFATFIRVRADRAAPSLAVEEGVTSGDFLDAFWQGTRDALTEAGRESITITVDQLDARTLGALIAFYERAVGFYAELINVNAYDQPGVEAGKKAAGVVIDLQRRAIDHLRQKPGEGYTADELATALEAPHAAERIHHLLTHTAANPDHGLKMTPGATIAATRFAAE